MTTFLDIVKDHLLGRGRRLFSELLLPRDLRLLGLLVELMSRRLLRVELWPLLHFSRLERLKLRSDWLSLLLPYGWPRLLPHRALYPCLGLVLVRCALELAGPEILLDLHKYFGSLVSFGLFVVNKCVFSLCFYDIIHF